MNRDRYRRAAPPARRWRGCAVVLAATVWSLAADAQPASPWAPALCVACHEAAVAHWREGPHAAAGAALDVGAQRDPRCQRCHVSDPARVDEGVRCDGCHGELAAHLAAPKKVRPGPEAPAERCARCHTATAPSVKPFDLQTSLARVRHPREVK